jgi:hypothetical protein
MESKENILFIIEETLNTIPGVLSSKVVSSGDQDDIEEIHIVSTTERNAKQISRDVQSIMTAKFNIEIDHKIISIAQINYDYMVKNEERIRIHSVNYSLSGNKVKVEVNLHRKDMIYSGTEEGPNTSVNGYRIIASATLKAIHRIMNQDHVFVIEDIGKIQIANKESMIVAIGIVGTMYEGMLVGTSLICEDIKHSIVKATLDAINRKVVQFC